MKYPQQQTAATKIEVGFIILYFEIIMRGQFIGIYLMRLFSNRLNIFILFKNVDKYLEFLIFKYKINLFSLNKQTTTKTTKLKLYSLKIV